MEIVSSPNKTNSRAAKSAAHSSPCFLPPVICGLAGDASWSGGEADE